MNRHRDLIEGAFGALEVIRPDWVNTEALH